MERRTIFEYCYRDGGNFKVFGKLFLKGAMPPLLEPRVRSILQDGEFFIAEQIGAPPLYEQLYKWSDGPVAADHCWHEFVGLKEMEANAHCEFAETVREFSARVASFVKWDETLSPHFNLCMANLSRTGLS